MAGAGVAGSVPGRLCGRAAFAHSRRLRWAAGVRSLDQPRGVEGAVGVARQPDDAHLRGDDAAVADVPRAVRVAAERVQRREAAIRAPMEPAYAAFRVRR